MCGNAKVKLEIIMVMRKKATKNSEVIKQVEFSPDRRITVSVGTSLDYGKAKVSLAQSQNIKNDADAAEQIDNIYDFLVGKLEETFDNLCERIDNPTNENENEDASEDDFEDEDASEGGDDLTEEDIMKMKKAELRDLIEEEELDVDTKMTIKKLREAVIDALFEPEDEDEDEDDDEDEEPKDEDDDEWDDDNWDD